MPISERVIKHSFDYGNKDIVADDSAEDDIVRNKTFKSLVGCIGQLSDLVVQSNEVFCELVLLTTTTNNRLNSLSTRVSALSRTVDSLPNARPSYDIVFEETTTHRQFFQVPQTQQLSSKDTVSFSMKNTRNSIRKIPQFHTLDPYKEYLMGGNKIVSISDRYSHPKYFFNQWCLVQEARMQRIEAVKAQQKADKKTRKAKQTSTSATDDMRKSKKKESISWQDRYMVNGEAVNRASIAGPRTKSSQFGTPDKGRDSLSSTPSSSALRTSVSSPHSPPDPYTERDDAAKVKASSPPTTLAAAPKKGVTFEAPNVVEHTPAPPPVSAESGDELDPIAEFDRDSDDDSDFDEEVDYRADPKYNVRKPAPVDISGRDPTVFVSPAPFQKMRTVSNATLRYSAVYAQHHVSSRVVKNTMINSGMTPEEADATAAAAAASAATPAAASPPKKPTKPNSRPSSSDAPAATTAAVPAPTASVASEAPAAAPVAAAVKPPSPPTPPTGIKPPPPPPTGGKVSPPTAAAASPSPPETPEGSFRADTAVGTAAAAAAATSTSSTSAAARLFLHPSTESLDSSSKSSKSQDTEEDEEDDDNNNDNDEDDHGVGSGQISAKSESIFSSEGPSPGSTSANAAAAMTGPMSPPKVSKPPPPPPPKAHYLESSSGGDRSSHSSGISLSGRSGSITGGAAGGGEDSPVILAPITALAGPPPRPAAPPPPPPKNPRLLVKSVRLGGSVRLGAGILSAINQQRTEDGSISSASGLTPPKPPAVVPPPAAPASAPVSVRPAVPSFMEAIRSGSAQLKKVDVAENEKQREAHRRKSSMGGLGDASVSAILERRKFLEAESSDDSDADDDDWK